MATKSAAKSTPKAHRLTHISSANRPPSKSPKAPKYANKVVKKTAPAKKSAAQGPSKARVSAKPQSKQPALLSGGNPQISKGYGDAPVQAYIAAMPGWKSALGRRLDQLIMAAVPQAQKAVKWNSPLYGREPDHWFLGMHVFARYVKVAFFRGASLRPMPPGESRQEHVRYLDIYEGDTLDELQFTAWVKQASDLPGEKM